MKLTHIRVENVKGCELADVTPNGSTTVVGGNNHQGKSSFLDGICMALGGKKLFPPDPIKEGEDEAEILIGLDGGTELLPWACQVNRIIRRREDGTTYTTRVEITAEDGSTAPSPQTILNAVVGKGLGFDPLGFVNLSPKDQVNTLKELVGLDFSELDTKRQQLYERRTQHNREAKQIDGKIKQTAIHTDVPSDKIDIAATVSKLGRAHDHNRVMGERETTLDKLGVWITQLRETITELENKLHDANLEASALKQTIEPSVDVSGLQATLSSAEEINRKIDENHQRLEMIAAKKSQEREARELGKAIDKIDKEKKRLAADAEWPIDGLGFGLDGVAYNGTAFSQLSSSEQLEISVSMALSLNKEFPFAIVRDGSLLDHDTLTEVQAIVAKHGGQCLLERVSVGDECHVIFEDGRARCQSVTN